MDKHLSQFHFINIAPNHIKRHLKALYIDNNRENPNNYMTAYEQTFGDSGEEKPFFFNRKKSPAGPGQEWPSAATGWREQRKTG